MFIFIYKIIFLNYFIIYYQELSSFVLLVATLIFVCNSIIKGLIMLIIKMSDLGGLFPVGGLK